MTLSRITTLSRTARARWKFVGYNSLEKQWIEKSKPKVKPKDLLKPDQWKIVKGDTVAIIAGADKGTTGKVVKVERHLNAVVVEGKNLAKKHLPVIQAGQKPGTMNMEKPIHISNVSLLDPRDGLPTKVSIVKDLDPATGKAVTKRIAKASGLEIPKPKPDLEYTKQRKEGSLDTKKEDVEKVTYIPSLSEYPLPRTARLVNHGLF